MKSWIEIRDHAIKTDNFKIITEVFDQSLENCFMCGVSGFPGSGKSTASEHYSETHKNVYWIDAKKSLTTKLFFTALLEKLGESVVYDQIRVHNLINKVAYLLNNGSGRSLIIIDEVDKIIDRDFAYLHEFRNLTESSTGLVLLGEKEFKDSILNMVEKKVRGMAAFHSRFFRWETLPSIPIHDKMDICLACGIKSQKDQLLISNRCVELRELKFEIFKYLNAGEKK